METIFNAIFINLEYGFIELVASSHYTWAFICGTYVSQFDRCTDTSYFWICLCDISIILSNLIIWKWLISITNLRIVIVYSRL